MKCATGLQCVRRLLFPMDEMPAAVNIPGDKDSGTEAIVARAVAVNDRTMSLVLTARPLTIADRDFVERK